MAPDRWAGGGPAGQSSGKVQERKMLCLHFFFPSSIFFADWRGFALGVAGLSLTLPPGPGWRRVQTVRREHCPGPVGSEALSQSFLSPTVITEMWKRPPGVRKRAATAEMPQEEKSRALVTKTPDMGPEWGRGKRRGPTQKCQDWGLSVNIPSERQLHFQVSSIFNGPRVHPALSILT